MNYENLWQMENEAIIFCEKPDHESETWNKRREQTKRKKEKKEIRILIMKTC